MKRCIIFSRVSTVTQILEQQTLELVTEAHKQGYSDEEIEMIEWKESAIKRDVEERESLQKLFQTITQYNIECVICRELSRIARRADVIYKVRDFLIEHKCNLIICKPYMKLLDENGKMSQTASIMFSLFGAISESEMSIKIERMMEGKIRLCREGKKVYQLPYGYTMDAERNIIIDKEKAKIVKKTYELIKTHSYAQIVKYFYDLGITISKRGIAHMLENRAYIGDYHDKYGNVIKIPRMLDDDTFNAAQAIREPRKIADKTRKHWLCSKLVICPCCGRKLVRRGVVYMCYRSIRLFKEINDPLACVNQQVVSVSIMDKLALYVAKQCLSIDLNNSKKDIKKQLIIELKENEKKQKALQARISTIDERKERLSISFEAGAITLDKFKSRLDDINKEYKDMLNEENYLVKRNNELNNDITNMTSVKQSIRERLKQFEDIKTIDYSSKDAYELVHRYITKITYKEVKKYNRILRFETTNNSISYFYVKGVGRTQTIWTSCELETLNKSLEDIDICDLTDEFKA